MTVVHPIGRAWITTGGTGAQNYDEFADEAEITPIIEANPRSALGVEMPHRAPDSPGRTLNEALPDAVARLASAKDDGYYKPVAEAVVLYRITEPRSEEAAYGMFCLVDTDQISTNSQEPGLVIRNEDVFIEKVRERVALAEATAHLLSPVLLLQTAHGAGAAGPEGSGAGSGQTPLHEAIVAACTAAGAPATTDVDAAGRTHAIWPVPPGATADRLCRLAGDGELVVADGNHRSLAAQIGELSRFLAVVTTPESVSIGGYHRLVGELPSSVGELTEQLTAAGAQVRPLAGRPETPEPGGAVHLYGNGTGYAVTLPDAPDVAAVDNMDHARVERVLFQQALGFDAGDKRITYVGGDYSPSWLCDEVDAGRAQLAVLIAPVTVDDFITVNLARQKLPRKSTWFTPKARAGLVLAQLDGAAR